VLLSSEWDGPYGLRCGKSVTLLRRRNDHPRLYGEVEESLGVNSRRGEILSGIDPSMIVVVNSSEAASSDFGLIGV
jgi:hypothetical protein